ncbi:MAG: SCO family protein [Candidatus Omnitrophica bacterium]|nr:SCO family protein [Candidatus Omnitrophota bacterium]MDE2213527.1 SCO family protein [Candidatus Omnitrophota bacterium]MDE2230572.1 SCO family protein [Candidatus Omnitrophota bacterium]
MPNLKADKVIFSILFLGFCFSWAGCGKQETAPAADNAEAYSALNTQRDFTLHDDNGKIFHLKDHRGQIVLLFFGYTTCPDVCPTTLSKLARVYALLGKKLRPHILTVFVTIDPRRDTPQKLKAYLKYFNINAIGLTGTKQQVDAVVHKYGASYERVESSSSALGYMFNHSDYIYLIDAHGKTSDLFHPEDTAEDMAKTIKGAYHG